MSNPHMEGTALTDRCTIRFALKQRARTILTTRDDFIAAMGALERSLRLRTAQPVSEAAFLAAVADSTRDWTPETSTKVAQAISAIQPRLSPFDLSLPRAVWMVHTTGEEEGGGAYTRDNAIILPPNKLDYALPALERLLIHELFHVLSRHDSQLRSALYGMIGFHPCGEVELPAELAARRITNPDAPKNDHYIQVDVAGRVGQVVPILLAGPAHDFERGGAYFDHVRMRLLEIEAGDAGWCPVWRGGVPVLWEMEQVRGFYEQVGRNTDYIIHPEEILAENFVHVLMQEGDLASPEIVRAMEAMLRGQMVL